MRLPRWRSRRNAELDAEIASHFELAVQERMARGESRADATAAAHREFGNVALVKETTREMWGWSALDGFKRDVGYALRTLRRSPGFTVAAVATLALGIGASTVIFSVADHVALRALPYPFSDRLVVVHEVMKEMRDTYPRLPANASHLLEWARVCQTCEVVAAIRPVTLARTGDGNPERLGAVRVSATLFPLLGARAVVGQLFTTDDEEHGDSHVAVLSHAYWQRAFGGEASVVGRTFVLNDVPWKIIGVLAPDFLFPKGQELGAPTRLPVETDVFTPLALTARERATPGEYDYSVIVRVAPRATRALLQAELDRVQADIGERHGQPGSFSVVTTDLQQEIAGSSARALVFLLAAVMAILLIVCVNLTNLLLARHASRSRESAVRVALGAKQGRLVRQALTESLVLASMGGALGLLFAWWGLGTLLRFAPADLPRLAEVRLDARVLLVAVGVSLVTGLLFGVLPSLRFGRVNPADVLKAGGRGSTAGRSARRTRAFLIASQVGLSALLLIATGLFLTSFVRVLHVDKGFAVEQVLALDVTLYGNTWNGPRRGVFYDQVLRQLAATPGVAGAALTTSLPLEGEQQIDMLSRERDTRPSTERPTASIRHVSPGYFAALSIPARQGRLIKESDRGRNVVVLSARAADALWPGENPIGKYVMPGSNDSLAEVVGVIPDVRTASMEREGILTIYLPYWQSPPPTATLLVRTTIAPASIAPAARAAVWSVGPAVPISHVRTMEQILSSALAQRRFQLLLLLLFAASALATASVGIYGIIAHSLAQRSNEIGVRMALGAARGDVHKLVLWEGLQPACIGLAAGIALSFVLGQSIRAQLFDVTPTDPITLFGVSLLLTGVAAIACYLPARRATGRGPAIALRAD